MRKLLLPFLLLVGIHQFAGLSAVASSDGDVKRTGTVTSIEAMTTGVATANSLELAAEYATQCGNYDQAIEICKRALSKNDNDADVHKAYAQALEGKWKHDKDENPEVYNACLREWLIVLRCERGEERGLTWRGLSLPMAQHYFEDEDRSMVAKVHLIEIAGSVPKPWETDDKYFKRTYKQTLNVSAKMLSSTPDKGAPAGKGFPAKVPASTAEVKPLLAAPAELAPPPSPTEWMEK